jgi:hypothetical protein
LVFAAGTLAGNRIELVMSEDLTTRQQGYIWVLLVAIGALIYGLSRFVYYGAVRRADGEADAERRALADAREKLASLDTDTLVALDSLAGRRSQMTVDEYQGILACDEPRMRGTVRAVWEIVNSHHNPESDATKRINFEATLIAPSLKDNWLTIAAWKNRGDKRPKSLLLRADNPQIYQATMAHKMIADRATGTLVIPDTSTANVEYKALYEGQLDRIKSTVLHPILAPTNEHLGVLVVHCDVADVFRKDKVRYWTEMLGIFDASLALVLQRIRTHNTLVEAWSRPPVLQRHAPF